MGAAENFFFSTIFLTKKSSKNRLNFVQIPSKIKAHRAEDAARADGDLCWFFGSAAADTPAVHDLHRTYQRTNTGNFLQPTSAP